ncbi:reverse transcriptase domain-containing protein [Streptosporangium sp. CA-115845]|uniref:reverse transcriptase/maturase family protein n=1 Tax=Streptosporangium sp. CA-115845 TaxID=3240071 RepID=UPI003D8D94FB
MIRLLLEAYYEPSFSGHSHGFRPGGGCHTALREAATTWTGTSWFIEGDVSDCFGSLDHDIMIDILAEKIRDGRFLRLLRNMLQAGYLEDRVWNATLSGAPQGGVLSPILSNIYLHRLDNFVETVLIPEYTQGESRNRNPAYRKVEQALAQARKRGDRALARELRGRLRSLPSKDPRDPGYRRLRYVRYADDTLLGFAGPKSEVEHIKARLAQFLREDLKLELSQDKTLITHARTRAARFLGYEIAVKHDDTKISHGRRGLTAMISLNVPATVIKAQCAPYLQRGKPARQPSLTAMDDYSIINVHGARYRGVVQYYPLAGDVYRLSRLHWVMQTSLLKTPAGKHRSSVAKMVRKLKTTIETPTGRRICLQGSRERGPGRKPLVARFGGIPLKRQKFAVLTDLQPARDTTRRKELIERLLSAHCEICGRNDKATVHQVRKLADLPATGPTQPEWARIMARRRRKTLVVCHPCHDVIHNR